MTGSTAVPKTINTLNVNCHVASLVHTAPGHSQRKELSPGSAGCLCISREIKICQRCFLCHSIVLCNTCNKCPSSCPKCTCRGKTSTLLGNLAGSGCRSESSSNPERGQHPPLSDLAQTHKVSYCHKLLCQSPQEQLPVGGITSAYRQECSRTSKKQNLSELFQPTIFSPQAKQKNGDLF